MVMNIYLIAFVDKIFPLGKFINDKKLNLYIYTWKPNKPYWLLP